MFSDRLRYLREREGLTQIELAAKFNIAPSTIGMYERNQRRPDFELLQKLADFFNVSTDYLLGRSDVQSPSAGDIAIPEDFVILARKAEGLSEPARKRIFKIIDSTFDNVLQFLEEEDRQEK